jgi:hypothetical protein
MENREQGWVMVKKIFSDEIGLFWIKMTSCSHISKAEVTASRIKVQNRITVLLGGKYGGTIYLRHQFLFTMQNCQKAFSGVYFQYTGTLVKGDG